MRLLALPERPLALLFDLDSTLYSHPAYAAFQTEVLVERLARERGESVAALEAEFARRRAAREAAGLGRTSLGNLFLELGVDIPTSVRWREELIDPAAWLARDPRLDEALAALAARFALALVTNNPRSVGEKSLEALGVRPRFPVVIGLDDTYRSKPDPAPYALAAERLGVAAEACVSVGDRHDVDLAPALALGMGAILVEAVEDVYALPAALRT
ncbi:MAG: HAD family hydrolase [Spirochaetaceae bacterium]|nr:HAD family hydrolase [Spirochaetaceae bacterium]